MLPETSRIKTETCTEFLSTDPFFFLFFSFLVCMLDEHGGVHVQGYMYTWEVQRSLSGVFPTQSLLDCLSEPGAHQFGLTVRASLRDPPVLALLSHLCWGLDPDTQSPTNPSLRPYLVIFRQLSWSLFKFRDKYFGHKYRGNFSQFKYYILLKSSQLQNSINFICNKS